MECRLYGITRKLQKGDDAGALMMIKETMDLLMTVYENEMTLQLTQYFYTMLQRMIIDIAVNQHDMANERLKHMSFTNSMCMGAC